MATPQQLETVSGWLKRVLVPYVQASLVHNQTLALLSISNSLAPRTEHFTYDDGRTQLLLTLKGTIPIAFRGATYNIPLAIWVPFNYPVEECLFYVVPTSNMLVRPSNKVELSGRVHMQELGQLELKDAVEALKRLFQKEPPVYAKPTGLNKSTSPSSSYPTPSPIVPPRPDIGTSSSSQSPRPPSSHSASSSRPPLPAPPTHPPASPVTPPLGRQTGPAQPQRPPPPPSSSTSSTPAPFPTSSRGGMSPPLPPTPARPLSVYSPSQTRTHSQSIRSLLDESEENDLSSQQQQQQQPHSASQHRPTPSQSEPARPLHPEVVALRSALLNRIQEAEAEHAQRHAESLRSFEAIDQELRAGNDAIQDELARLRAVHQVVCSVRDRYAETVDAAQRRVKALEEKEDPEVDEILACPAPIHAQLLHLLSSDAALEDTIYQLGRSLHSGADERTVAVDMEKTLKRIRNLAREQFFDRALANKVLLELAVASVDS